MTKLTIEQEAFIKEVARSEQGINLDSVAGSGKTFTSVAALNNLARERPYADNLCVAFNKRNADELAARMGSSAECRTMNALGHRAWMRKLNKQLKVDTLKVVKNVGEALDGEKVPEEIEGIYQLIRLAKANGLVPSVSAKFDESEPLTEDHEESWMEMIAHFDVSIEDGAEKYAIEVARDALCIGIDDAFDGNIDFDDQLYMSICWGAPFRRFANVLVDEAQDMSTINRLMLQRSLTEQGRLFAVGDPYQAIYGFRGAASNSMEMMREIFNNEIMNLTYCFRCSRSVIIEAQKIVPHIQYPEAAPVGSVTRVGQWNSSMLPEFNMVLCRNTAPLVWLVFRAISKQIPAYILGRDIGKTLARLVSKIARDGKDLNTFMKNLEVWRKKEVRRATLLNNEAKAELAYDKESAIKATVESLENPETATSDDIEKTIAQIFDDKRSRDGGICLSTIHRAKGMESPRVAILDLHLMPSKYATQHWQLEQERNLKYVAKTRAQQDLYYIDSRLYDRDN